MTTLDGALATWFADRLHVASRPELVRYGLTRHQIDGLVEAGLLLADHRSVYRVAGSARTLESQARSACIASDDVVVCGPAAARLWRMRRAGPSDVPLHVHAPHGLTPLGRGVQVHRTSMLLPGDIVRRDDGIRLTSPPMTVFGCAKHLDDLDLESMIEDCLRRRLFTMPTLLALGRRVVAPGRAGSARFARVVSGRPGWLRPADSHLEVVLFDALCRAGVPGLVRQHPLVLRDGRRIRFDVASPALRWGVEVDHVTWHGGRLDAQHDKARDRAARRCGWQVDRVTDTDVAKTLDATVAELVDLHDRRADELARLA